MGTYLETALEELKALVENLAELVEENVRLATDAVINNNPLLIDTVKDNDKEIDKKEIHIEEACTQLLAMHYPKAKNLRFVVAVLKANNDLERISDLAVNMVKSVKVLSKSKERETFQLPNMVEKVLIMLNKSIKALLDLDPQLAITVCSLDDEVDALKHNQRKEISEIIKQKTEHPEYFLDILINGRRLERIADLCTNLAEDVIYITEGKIIRHNTWQATKQN